MNLENEINNYLKIENNQKNFFNTLFGKVINNAIDIGLKSILPDLIEDEIINIKNTLFENGLKGGVETTINTIINYGKSALGIVTGNFENIDQINMAIKNGGIIDTISDVLDKSIKNIYEKGYINSTINTIIKNGKNVILDNVTNNIKKEFNNQAELIESLEKYVTNWKEAYNNKDFNIMEKEYKKIEKSLNKAIPIENLLKETRKIEVIHNLIKNNGNNFEITEEENELIDKFSN